jgi:hypothetical protein
MGISGVDACFSRMNDARSWAYEEFGGANLGDARRKSRLVRLMEGLVGKPSGLVSEVYKAGAERQAAYDFLSNDAVRSGALLDATASATAARCVGNPFTYVMLDGTTLTLTDRTKTKPLGSVGARRFPTRGLLALDAVAVTPDGTLQGLLDIQFWARGAQAPSTGRRRRRREEDNELRHWGQGVERASDLLEACAPETRPWFIMDRESDQAMLLRKLEGLDALFTLRASHDRIVEYRGRRTRLFSAIRASKVVAKHVVELPQTATRHARRAKLEIRATRLTLLLPTYRGHNNRSSLEVGVVEIREVGDVPKPLHWVLLTSAPLETPQDIDCVFQSYRLRWRVEDFHRTWKSGGCDVEDIQLRSADGIRKWAIMLGAVAARIERIKHLSRTRPDEPATIELSEDEISALIIAKRRIKNSVELVPDDTPTMRQATRWIGDLGGYAGHYKNYEPGAKTIGRGLAELEIWVSALRFMRENPKELRKKR